MASDEASAAGSGVDEHSLVPAHHNKTATSASVEDDREGAKVTKLKRLQDVKMGPLKSRLKAVARKGVPVPVVPRRRRGRPPSAERLKAEAAAAAAARSGSSAAAFAELPLPDARTVKQKAFRVRGRDRELDLQTAQQQQQQAAAKLRAPHADPQAASPTEPQSPPSSKFGRPLGLRQSPRHIKPVRIVPPSKRTDATIAKQLLQRAKKGAQKKKLLEKESGGSGGQPGMEASIRRRRRTPLKNIRQFIMPVVSTVSRRIIKTPKRFIEDEASFSTAPPLKVSRLETPAYASASTVTSLSSSAAVPQPSVAPSPTLVATSSPSSASVGPGVGASVGDSLPPPPPPVVPAATTNSGGSIPSSLLNNAAVAASGSTSNGGRFSSSAASCGSSAVSQHSSQLSSGESSRSSSPSLDDSSCDSQASEGTQALSEEPDRSPGSSQGEREEPALMHPSRPSSPPSEHEHEHTRLLERGRRGRRGQGVRSGAGLVGRGRSALIGPRKKTIISPATGILMSSSQVGTHQASSAVPSGSSPSPPQHVLGAGQHPSSGSSSNPAGVGDHHPHSSWIMPRGIPPFLTGASMHASCHDKRRSILREPTFRWSSAPSHKPECFSSAKYAKEGLIRKPVFDNFRPPPLTAEDVGLVPGPVSGGVAPSGFTASSSGGAGASGRLFSPLHHHHHPHTSSRFEGSYTKRSPLLRAPRFTPSEAHSRIFESVTLPTSSSSSPGSLSPLQGSSPTGRNLRHRRRRTIGSLGGQPRSPSHSMTRRSSQSSKSPSDHMGSSSGNARDSVSLQGVAVSPLAPSALPQPSFTLPPGTAGLSAHGSADGRKVPSTAAPGSLGAVGNSAGSSSSSPSQLFPLFGPGGLSGNATGASGGKAARERNLSAGHDSSAKERDRESERSREREKENKREGRKEKERKGKDGSSHVASSLFGVDGKDLEKSVSTLATRKIPGRKKLASADSGTEASPADGNTVGGNPSSNGRPSKKDRPPDWDAEADRGEKDDRERTSTPVPPGQTGKTPAATNTTTPTPSLESMLAHAEKQPEADKQLAGLLKKAKAQLHNIENKSLKSLKPLDQPKVQVRWIVVLIAAAPDQIWSARERQEMSQRC